MKDFISSAISIFMYMSLNLSLISYSVVKMVLIPYSFTPLWAHSTLQFLAQNLIFFRWENKLSDLKSYLKVSASWKGIFAHWDAVFDVICAVLVICFKILVIIKSKKCDNLKVQLGSASRRPWNVLLKIHITWLSVW